MRAWKCPILFRLLADARSRFPQPAQVSSRFRHPIRHADIAQRFVRPEMQPVGRSHFGGQSFQGLQRVHGVILPALAGFKHVGLQGQTQFVGVSVRAKQSRFHTGSFGPLSVFAQHAIPLRMKSLLSCAVQLLPDQSAVSTAPGPVGSTPILAPTGAAIRADRRYDLGASRTQPCVSRRHPQVAPSLRLRATTTNRSLLRWLRAAELAAWQDADARALRELNYFHH